MPSVAPTRPRRPIRIEMSFAVAALAVSVVARALWSVPGPFLPSPAYNWPVALAYALSAAAAFAVFFFLERRQRRYPPSDEQHYAAVPINLLLALLVGGALALACDLPLKILHHRSESSLTTRVEPISLSREGGRGSCKNHAVVEGDSEFRGARLCIGSDEAFYRQLDADRRVELSLSRSRYGTAVDSFGPIQAEAGSGAAKP